MKKFSDMGIKRETTALEGEKIAIERILNTPITVEAFRIEPSKFTEKGNSECLHLQIKKDNVKRVVFIGSKILIDMIRKIKEEDFPFETTIIKDNGFQFT